MITQNAHQKAFYYPTSHTIVRKPACVPTMLSSLLSYAYGSFNRSGDKHRQFASFVFSTKTEGIAGRPNASQKYYILLIINILTTIAWPQENNTVSFA